MRIMGNYLSKSCQSSILLINFRAFGREGVSKFYNGKSASPARLQDAIIPSLLNDLLIFHSQKHHPQGSVNSVSNGANSRIKWSSVLP